MSLLKIDVLKRDNIISWWESHRFFYNIYMLFIGLLSFFVGYATIPILYILIGFSLNLLFTVSWIIEKLIIRPINSPKITRVYVQLFLIIMYVYSTVSVLFYVRFPFLLDWMLSLYI